METSEKSKHKRIAVLGSTGQVGTLITQTLCKRFPDAKILACVHTRKRNGTAIFPANYQEVQFDPFEEEWSKLGKVDILINSIGIIEETKTLSFEKAHKGVTEKILLHRSQLGDPLIIQVSVLGAEERSSSPFMNTKAIADRELLKEARTWVIRPSIVCTHNTAMVQELKMIRRISRYSLNTLVFPSRLVKTKMQPVMGEDVAGVIAGICEKEPGIHLIPVTGPKVFQLEDLIRLCNPNVRILPFPEVLFRGAFSLASRLFPKWLKREQFNLLGTDNVADQTVAEKILGRSVETTDEFWRKELN
jgi:uncharacterized protein YbjT (DUF2867 family)